MKRRKRKKKWNIGNQLGKTTGKGKWKRGKRGKGYKKGKGQKMKTRKRIGEKGEMRIGKKEKNKPTSTRESRKKRGDKEKQEKRGKGENGNGRKWERGKSKNKCLFVSEFRDLYKNLRRHLGLAQQINLWEKNHMRVIEEKL